MDMVDRRASTLRLIDHMRVIEAKIGPTNPVCIITVNHWPFSLQNVAMAVHFSVPSDKPANRLLIRQNDRSTSDRRVDQ